MSFSSQKGEFDQFFNRLDRPVEESRPDRPVDPTGFHLWFIVYLLMIPMLSIFTLAIKVDGLFLTIFQNFHLLVSFVFDKLASP